MRYRRAWVPGGTYFFTLVTYNRNPILLTGSNPARLGRSLRHIRSRHPFELPAIVILPDHLHMMMRLPEGDYDFAVRIRLIKSCFTRACSFAESAPSFSRERRHERPVWQRRFWEHLIRDADDWRRHLDYLHFNPVKHGYVGSAADWQWSSFRRYQKAGAYPPSWGAAEPREIVGMEME